MHYKDNYLYFYVKTPMNSIIAFPVKSYIKKYLTFKYGEKFVYTNHSTLAPIIRSTISDDVKEYRKKLIIDNYYLVELTEYYVNKFDVVFNSKKIVDFNYDVESLFREELFQFAKLNKRIYNIDYTISLSDFLKKIDITEDELKFDTILKDFNRKLDKKPSKCS